MSKPGLRHCMTEGSHCYCLDAEYDSRRTKPHVECCKCGDVKLAPWKPPVLSVRYGLTGRDFA